MSATLSITVLFLCTLLGPTLLAPTPASAGEPPAINLVKLTNGTNNNSPPGPMVPVGSTVTFTYVVTDTGNAPLSGVVVRDDNGTPARL